MLTHWHQPTRNSLPTRRKRSTFPSRSLAIGLLGLTATTAQVHSQTPAAPSAAATTLPPVVVEAKPTYAAERATTATKTDTPLIDTPQSVTVLTGEFLSDTAVNSIGDAVRYVPGVGTAQGEGNRDTVVFRGNSSTGDYFIDGLRDDAQYYRDFYNIDRVEVLKGPSGMIFGRGGPGGVLNRVTKQAVIGGTSTKQVGDGKSAKQVVVQEDSSFYEISALVGSLEQYRTTIDLNQSLSAAAAARLTGVFEDSNSYRDGVSNQRIGVNPTFGVALSDDTTLRLGFEYFHDERTADRGIPSFNGKPFDTDESTFFGDADRSPTEVDVFAINAVIDHKFANGATLRNATRVAWYDKFYQNVYASGAVTSAGTVAIGAYNNATERQNFINQTDLVFDFKTGSVEHKMLAGIEVSRQETDNLRETGYSSSSHDTGLGSVSAAHPHYTGPLFFRQSASDANNNSVATGVAFYLQDQVQLLPKLQLIAGLRLDLLEIDFHNNRNGENINSTDDLLSPRVGLVYKPVENLAIYGSYTLAYVPRAGEQLASLSVTNSALEPEEFENFEAGVKWDATERLAFTLAAYQLDRSNQAIADPNDSSKLILMDGQRVRGIEFGASGQITDNWSIALGYAYQDGETQSANGAIPAGTPIAQLPKNSFSLWNRYDFDEHWGVGFGAIYRDEIYAAADNHVTLPSFVRFDAALFYRFNENLSAQLNVENIFGEEYYATAHNNNNITPGSPVAFRVGVTYKF
ncbi:TonB-dependent siderophore receptor [Roseimicrobium sp. ORNL1]|uniref:TonB-dependent receptor n=1 Tax=Roseimicrobium sp. ORNL1 TaxID=2711231 RepID=UPI0013E14272|nr:TonB-dependent siderophore receptor [Roseimicrobium sp. ORNL1]QIF03824.1 TonB-dependent siderophore receptor [Roseimicrobium sp. ORNL1]